MTMTTQAMRSENSDHIYWIWVWASAWLTFLGLFCSAICAKMPTFIAMQLIKTVAAEADHVFYIFKNKFT